MKKWKLTIGIVLILVATTWVMESCKKTESPNTNATPIQLEIPSNFPAPQNVFANNPLTSEGFALGRKLFYDGRLSKDGNFPCASCHQQFAAFATYDHSLSHGFDNQFTTRNAPGLFNMAWQKEFQWDGGINHLELQPLAPITAPNEMAETVDAVISKLKQDPTYPKLFADAFGSDEINSQRMLKALTQFVGTMVSAYSKYDKVKRGAASFTDAEQQGYTLFQAKCATCHAEPLFTDLSYRNTGLPVNSSLMDLGRMKITRNSEDSLKFKVPSLRNVNITFPYGHDGRFYSIGAVIDHYRLDVVDGPTTDPLVRNKISLTDDDRYNLILFLRTLTDSTFISDKRFSQPN